MKKLLLGISSLALVAAAAVTTISTINDTPESDLLTKNLEALSWYEDGDSKGWLTTDTTYEYEYNVNYNGNPFCTLTRMITDVRCLDGGPNYCKEGTFVDIWYDCPPFLR